VPHASMAAAQDKEDEVGWIRTQVTNKTP
jgi:hypothetical protein